MKYHDPSLPPEFWQNLPYPRRATSCWTWRGVYEKSGYVRFGGRPAHRLVYEALVGPIPEGLVIDHVCHNKLCMNPEHLEAVTSMENLIRRRDHPTRKELRDDDRKGLPYKEWRPRSRLPHRPTCLFCDQSRGHSSSCTRPKIRPVKLRRARNNHTCCACGAGIQPGDLYHYHYSIDEADRTSTRKHCVSCWKRHLGGMPIRAKARKRRR
jgi:hypothetical protein